MFQTKFFSFLSFCLLLVLFCKAYGESWMAGHTGLESTTQIRILHYGELKRGELKEKRGERREERGWESGR